MKFETIQVHAGQETPDATTGARAVPIYLTTSFVFDDCAQAEGRFALSEPGNIYTRLGNPTTDVFERRMAALEGGAAALATASGSAAVDYAIRNIAQNGDHIVSDSLVYGGTYNLFAHTLPEAGITATFVSSGKPEDFAAAIRPNTKAIFVESLGNPNSTVIDIAALAEIAHKNAIPLIVDNTFATPYLLRPIEHGADVVVHSATKFIGGHGVALGGVIVDSGKFPWEKSGKFPGLTEPSPGYHGAVFTQAAGAVAYAAKIRTTLLRDTGAAVSPFHSFLFLQGLETLSLRVERHVRNALKVAEYLANHPKVEKVNHPSMPDYEHHDLYKRYFAGNAAGGAGSIFTFELKDAGAEETKAWIDRLKLFSLLANVADAKSLVIHPASTTHSQMNTQELAESRIKPNTVRLSIGIEHIDDILADLEQAFG